MSTAEPRALSAALASPAFVTRGAGLAMHAANRHVERWAPEEGANRLRPLRNLGFVDRLVSPWIESAQRSAGLRMFSQYVAPGAPDVGVRGVRSAALPDATSWVFPRPWYQDELDWMAAARAMTAQTVEQAPMLTTRGTYVQPAQAMPPVLHEYVAPSLSLARPDVQTAEAYSPLVPFAAAQAAHVMAHAIAPIASSAARMSPGLRTVLSTMLERTTQAHDVAPTRRSLSAPALETPPAPRAAVAADATQIADQFAEQHAHVAELQRMARLAAEREAAARVVAQQPSTDAQLAEIRAAQQRAVEARQAEQQRRTGDARRDDSAAAAAERARIEERIAQRVAQVQKQEALRLHEQSRDAAARDARVAAAEQARSAEPAADAAPSRVATEIAAAVAALPPQLASMVAAGISQRPERAVHAIAELGEALRSVELIARNTAAGGTIEATRGPRVVMPAGLGGLVSTIDRTAAPAQTTAMTAMPPMIATAPRAPARMPAMPFIQPRTAAPLALGAAASTPPAALSHVAWSDRWLARFAGARPQSLDVLAAAASPHARMQILASTAPDAVFVAPAFPAVEDRFGASAPRGEPGFDVGFARGAHADVLPTLRAGAAPAQPVLRFADDAEVPDDMLAAIAISANRSRVVAAQPPAAPRPSLPPVDPDRYQPRDTFADVVAHVAPAAPSAGLSAQLASSPFAPALRHLLPLGSAPSFDVRALFGAGISASYLAGLIDSQTSELAIEPTARTVPELDLAYVAPTLGGDDDASVTTLRSALLTLDVETIAAAPGETRALAQAIASAPLARTMLESLALPMLADTAPAHDHATTHTAPGMLADRMQTWSVAQERSSADLSYDFIAPELVLAARVYGLGPAEAAQAMRLAIAGPGQLSAMAGTVDRTFVQAMAIEAERRGERTRMVTAYPLAAGDTASASLTSAMSAPGDAPTAFTPAHTAFGVERRAPRGAFLWPAGTTAALGLTAASPDGAQSMTVAALELLAAQAVAELGTYTALGELAGSDAATSHAATGAIAPTSRDTVTSEADVLASAAAIVPAARREKFQALYLALGQSPAGRAASPAARAARALALAGRGEDTVSARERATIAWDVLPMVYGVDAGEPEALSTGDAAARVARRRDELRSLDPVFVDARPGLAHLSARAGEALGAYVAPPAPAPAAAASSSSPREVGAVLRAPTAAPELVQTGRPAARTGGGEVEIPAWFEQAARKMFESKSSGVSESISIAELTLVTAAPAAQVAASTRVAGGAPPVAISPSIAVGAEKQAIDVEKLANDVYREVLVLMDIARARNGEPYI